MEGQLCNFHHFLDSKTHWKKNTFLTFCFKKFFKRVTPINFLPQKFIVKYGILSTFSVAFVSQKILTYIQCKLEQKGKKLPAATVVCKNNACPRNSHVTLLRTVAAGHSTE